MTSLSINPTQQCHHHQERLGCGVPNMGDGGTGGRMRSTVVRVDRSSPEGSLLFQCGSKMYHSANEGSGRISDDSLLNSHENSIAKDLNMRGGRGCGTCSDSLGEVGMSELALRCVDEHMPDSAVLGARGPTNEDELSSSTNSGSKQDRQKAIEDATSDSGKNVDQNLVHTHCAIAAHGIEQVAKGLIDSQRNQVSLGGSGIGFSEIADSVRHWKQSGCDDDGVGGVKMEAFRALSKVETASDKGDCKDPSTEVKCGGKRDEDRLEKSTEKSEGGQPRFWTAEEHIRFLEAVRLYGYGNARQIAAYVQTRNITQVRTHAQKYILKLSRMGSAPAKVCKRMRVVKDSYIKPNPHPCLCLPLSC
jgi:SHAQKYF class myb-like DNA-binding protein